MPSLRRASLAALALAFAGRGADAMPPRPVPLEKRIADTPLIVVARLTTQPVHSGDPYDVEVEETLKGAATAGPLRVRAAWYWNGDVEMPNQPEPRAGEAGGKRVILFLQEEKDGARNASSAVRLDPDEGMPAWFWIGVFAKYKAAYGPAAIRALVQLDDPATDAKTAATLWVRGLSGENPLLVNALL